MAVEVVDSVARQNLVNHESTLHAPAYNGTQALDEIRLRSPNGTIYRVTVTNAGVLETEEV
jgi:hypothetical protein